MAERADEWTERGLSPHAARTQALRAFGNVRALREESAGVWRIHWLSEAVQDLRYASRSLARAPGFTGSCIGILAIGIGLLTAFLTIFNGDVLRPWMVPDPSSLAVLRGRPIPGKAQPESISYPEYRFFREHAQAFRNLAASLRGGGPVTYRGLTRDVQTNFVSANFFRTLGIPLKLGHDFAAEDEDYRQPHAVVVISEPLWRIMFDASPAVIGETIRVRDRPFTIIGVAATNFVDVDGIGARPAMANGNDIRADVAEYSAHAHHRRTSRARDSRTCFDRRR